MKKTILLLAFIIPVGLLCAQESDTLVKEGTVMTLGTATLSGYDHIDFPRRNVIMKRGAIANFSDLSGKKVIAENVRTNADGSTTADLKREDGQKFFRFYTSVSTDLDKALEDGELTLVSSVGKEAIAK